MDNYIEWLRDKDRLGYNLNELLIKFKKEKKKSASTIAKDLGIDKMQLSNWRNGKIMPNAENLKKLSEYFGVSPENFFIIPVQKDSEQAQLQSDPNNPRLIKDLPYGVQKIIEISMKISNDNIHGIYDLYSYACKIACINENEREDERRFLSKEIADRISLGMMKESEKK